MRAGPARNPKSLSKNEKLGSPNDTLPFALM